MSFARAPPTTDCLGLIRGILKMNSSRTQQTTLEMATIMSSKSEVEVLIVSDLAALCEKLAKQPTVPDKLRRKALGFVEEYNSLLPYGGEGTRPQHFEGEELLIRIARFLPAVPEELDDEREPE